MSTSCSIEPVDCAEHAIAFACGVSVERADYELFLAGRSVFHDGTTDVQIAKAVRLCSKNPVLADTESRTLRTFAREKRDGHFIVFTCDHVVACVNGFLCDRPENSDLARIEKIWKII